MANVAELYARLDPFEASEDEFQRLGARIHERAIETAREAYRGDVTVEVVITAGSAKIKVRVMQALLALDLTCGHLADWKSFREQAVAIYQSSTSVLSGMAMTVPHTAYAP